jgi:hypothetical protein
MKSELRDVEHQDWVVGPEGAWKNRQGQADRSQRIPGDSKPILTGPAPTLDQTGGKRPAPGGGAGYGAGMLE